jgi:hypothetical protein
MSISIFCLGKNDEDGQICEVVMFEIQEEFHTIKKNDHQISRIILERTLCNPNIWENIKNYECCGNYVKNAHSNWYL